MNFRNVTGWVLLVIGGLAFFASGVMKLTGPQQMKDLFTLFGLPLLTMYVIAIVEIVSVISLFTRWMRYGAAALVVVGIGAAIEHATHGQPGPAMAPLILAIFIGLGAWLRAPMLLRTGAAITPRI